MEMTSHTLLNYLIETSICLAVFYAFYVLVLRRQPAFAYNRVYLLVSSLLALVLPLLEVPFLGSTPQEFTRMAPDFSVLVLPDVVIGEVDEAVSTISWQQMVLWAYGVGVLLMLMRFLWQILSIHRIIRQGKLSLSKHGYWVVQTNGRLPISSYFNYLLWDNQVVLNEADKHRIIEHEEVHMAQGHSYDVCYMSVIKIMLWFNPLAYLYFKELTDVHEYAADAKVVHNTDIKAYAKILVNQLFHKVDYSLLNHFYKSRTLKRLKMMEQAKSKINRYRVLWALPVFALMFFVFSCQEEEETMILAEESVKNYEDIQEEIRTTRLELQRITQKYPNYKLNFAPTPDRPPIRFESADDFINIVDGVENNRDKETIGQLHFKIITLQKKLDTQAIVGTDEVYTVVQDQPTPEGGMRKFYDYVGENLKYPEQARTMGIEGRVFVQFVVDKDGSLTDVKAVKGIGAGCDEEAVRVLQNSPAWNPGRQRDKAVKVRMVLPITFNLGGENEIVITEGTAANSGNMNIQYTKDGNRISGKIIDEDGKPMAGVNILFKGSTLGTVSDMNGVFVLNKTVESSTLVFSAIGFKSKQIEL